MESIVKSLFELQDKGYRDFHLKLMPGVEPERVIGVRTPQLRRLAGEIAGTPQAAEFLGKLPHYYYEENNLHGLLICRIKDFNACLGAVNAFLPFVDNWATCDMLSPKALIKQPERLLEEIDIWLKSEKTYTVRFGISRLMAHFLDERFSGSYPAAVAAVNSDEYYINMMRAWYFATALAKQYDAVLPYFTERRLDRWTHNKAIQKANESFRVSPEHKSELKALKY